MKLKHNLSYSCLLAKIFLATFGQMEKHDCYFFYNVQIYHLMVFGGCKSQEKSSCPALENQSTSRVQKEDDVN